MFLHASLRLEDRKGELVAVLDNQDLQPWLAQHSGPDVALGNILRDHSDRAHGLIDQCYESVIDKWSSLSPLAGTCFCFLPPQQLQLAAAATPSAALAIRARLSLSLVAFPRPIPSN
jgi:hypothetical protein